MARNFYVFDFFAVLVLFSIVTTYVLVFDAGGTEIPDDLFQSPMELRTRNMLASSTDSIGNFDRHSPQYDSNVGPMRSKGHYQEFLEDAPACGPLEYDEVTFGLAVALEESELSMVHQHCRRWGISAPMSIAVWTDNTPEQVMEQLQSFDRTDCNPEQMTITTLTTAASAASPLNQLRNLAFQGLQTTHGVYLDIQMLPSVDLYDVLHSPTTVAKLAENPKLAIVIPSFEVETNHVKDDDALGGIPATFESLIMQLSNKRANIMGANDIALQGSTLYRSWVQQGQGELVSLDCVSSDYYEPFLAVRYCEGLPPFQEVLVNESSNDETKHDLKSTWVIHLLRLGYSFAQVGGGFVIDLPKAMVESKSNPKPGTKGDLSKSLRKLNQLRKRFTRYSFLEWLRQTVPDQRTMAKCDDFELSEDNEKE
eukprot:CAMPEP_0197274310 /NCGR_PEP_ID=MMETSP1432-20130617/12489_1 /TAXON_ID=44447 /ORGANISM="Pseudo-nitzschia delicatissima, Strain UNC1205" /LENGTH=423 /DNA_ID=CAMNT_0042740087 /DNA_START=74 /DNA_END=1345 /DNA_ORIENTATION=+